MTVSVRDEALNPDETIRVSVFVPARRRSLLLAARVLTNDVSLCSGGGDSVMPDVSISPLLSGFIFYKVLQLKLLSESQTLNFKLL